MIKTLKSCSFSHRLVQQTHFCCLKVARNSHTHLFIDLRMLNYHLTSRTNVELESSITVYGLMDTESLQFLGWTNAMSASCHLRSHFKSCEGSVEKRQVAPLPPHRWFSKYTTRGWLYRLFMEKWLNSYL